MLQEQEDRKASAFQKRKVRNLLGNAKITETERREWGLLLTVMSSAGAERTITTCQQLIVQRGGQLETATAHV